MSTVIASPSIIRPEISVPLGDSSVTVRELPGDLALQFYALLAKHLSGVLAPAISVAPDGKMSADLAGILRSVAGDDGSVSAENLAAKLCGLVASVEELSTFLVTRCTDDPDAMRKHGALQCLALLDAALEVNLTPEHLALLKRVGGRVGAFLAAQKSDTPKSATS